MSVHLVLFLAFGAVALAGAINLLAQTHPINSALSLIAVMAALAGEYLLLGAEFVAAVQVIVYAGALPGDPKTIGQMLFHEFLLPFEITSVLILVAIMGAVVLASKPPTSPAGGPARKVD